VCNLKGASENCPASCGSKQECFSNQNLNQVYFAWDRIRLISPTNGNGSLCLGQGFDKNTVVKECKSWLESLAVGLNGERILDPSDGCSETLQKISPTFCALVTQRGLVFLSRTLNLTDCAQLETAIDESCDFDMKPIRDFTRDMSTNDGYAIGFWVKPVDELSLSEDQFIPKISFHNSISPPQTFLSVSKDDQDTTAKIYVQSRGRCGPHENYDVPLQDFSTSGWSFVAISEKYYDSEPARFPPWGGNGSCDESGGASHTTQPERGSFAMQNQFVAKVRPVGLPKPHIFAESPAYFKAIEVNVPMLIR